MRTLLCLFSLLIVGFLPANADQVLREGDVFRIAIGGAPRQYTSDFELEYKVSDGMVTIPIIGRMRAAGLTPNALAGAIEKRLKDDKIFTNPSVILNQQETARQVVVGGAVRQPGRHPWANDMTLTQAIASASGPSEWAEDKVKLIRAGRAEVYSRKAIKKQPETDPKVLPGDFVEVQGEF